MLSSADELGDFAAELKLSFYQLGISPLIIASILMQVWPPILILMMSPRLLMLQLMMLLLMVLMLTLILRTMMIS